jgi:uncharacterized membrane protein YgaE (UPF0421/DUF939 family)
MKTMTNNKQKTNPENPNNQFSNSEPMTFTQKVEYVKSIDMTNNKQQTEINAVEYIDKVNQFAKENNTGKPKQQTAVEWLWEIAYNRELTVADWKQAKEMEKQRMIDFANNCIKQIEVSDTCELLMVESPKDLYNETYKGEEQ